MSTEFPGQLAIGATSESKSKPFASLEVWGASIEGSQEALCRKWVTVAEGDAPWRQGKEHHTILRRKYSRGPYLEVGVQDTI